MSVELDRLAHQSLRPLGEAGVRSQVSNRSRSSTPAYFWSAATSGSAVDTVSRIGRAGSGADAAADWPETDRRMAAGMLDVLWGVMSYERLVAAWELTPQQATRAITWVIGLIEAAICDGRAPEGGPVRQA